MLTLVQRACAARQQSRRVCALILRFHIGVLRSPMMLIAADFASESASSSSRPEEVLCTTGCSPSIWNLHPIVPPSTKVSNRIRCPRYSRISRVIASLLLFFSSSSMVCFDALFERNLTDRLHVVETHFVSPTKSGVNAKAHAQCSRNGVTFAPELQRDLRRPIRRPRGYWSSELER